MGLVGARRDWKAGPEGRAVGAILCSLRSPLIYVAGQKGLVVWIRLACPGANHMLVSRWLDDEVQPSSSI